MTLVDKNNLDFSYIESLKTTDLMTIIITRILDGEVLSDIDLNRFNLLLFSIGVYNDIQLKQYHQLIKKFRQAIPNFLNKIDEILIQSEKNRVEFYKLAIRELEKNKSRPQFSLYHDSPEMISFIRSLTKEHYSFSQAANILGKTRQTLDKYAREQLHGLKYYWVNKTKRLLKSDMVVFYRDLHFKNYDPFEILTKQKK